MSTDFPTSVRFSEKAKADLKKIAKAQGCSLTWLVKDIVDKWLEWKKKQK